MWNTKGKNSTDLIMTEGDYGIDITFVIEGVSIGSSDTILLTVKKAKNGSALIEKEFTANDDGSIDLAWTESESDDLKVGNYFYSLDWYNNGQFMCNVLNNGKLTVEDKI